MIFCRRFRACSGLGSPLFVVMVRRMCGFTSPSRSASRVRPLGAGLLPGSPPWGVSRRALRQAGPFGRSFGRSVCPGSGPSAPASCRVSAVGGFRRALRQAGPFGRSFGRSVCPGSGPSAPASCRVSAVGRVSPRIPAGGTLRQFFRPERVSRVRFFGVGLSPGLRRGRVSPRTPAGGTLLRFFRPEPVSRVRPLGAGLLPGLRRGACLAAYSGRRDPSRVFPPERPLEARPSA